MVNNMLIIYDNNGKIWYNGTAHEVPDAIHVLQTNIPIGQYVESVDMTQIPHVPILKEYPKSALELVKEANEKHQADIDYLMLLNENLI